MIITYNSLSLHRGLYQVKAIVRQSGRSVNKSLRGKRPPRRNSLTYKRKEDRMIDPPVLERKTRLELATPTLARLCSTN